MSKLVSISPALFGNNISGKINIL